MLISIGGCSSTFGCAAGLVSTGGGVSTTTGFGVSDPCSAKYAPEPPSPMTISAMAANSGARERRGAPELVTSAAVPESVVICLVVFTDGGDAAHLNGAK